MSFSPERLLSTLVSVSSCVSQCKVRFGFDIIVCVLFVVIIVGYVDELLINQWADSCLYPCISNCG